MGFEIKQLWTAPEINPYNKKAKSIPVFNPINKYGRVFFFSYLGFFIAFWSWYAFPPLVSSTSSLQHHVFPVINTFTAKCQHQEGPSSFPE
jgi:NNP family nitrate/nitrite transporter-like MFS transporter